MLNILFKISIFITLIIIQSCDANLDPNPNTYNGDTYLRGKIVEEETLSPLDSVKIVIYDSELLGQTSPTGLEFYTDSIGEFDYYFEATMNISYSFKVFKDEYEVTFPVNYGTSNNDFDIEKGESQFYNIRMAKIYPIELNRSVSVASFVFTSLDCIDSSYSELNNLTNIFPSEDYPFWPFEQIIFISDDELKIMDNTSNLSEPFSYQKPFQHIFFSSNYGEFDLLGSANNIVDYSYYYLISKNGPYSSLYEEEKGRGELTNALIDSIRNILTENDTLFCHRYELLYSKE